MLDHIAFLSQPTERVRSNKNDRYFRIRIARDPDEHARNLTGWKQQYDQLSRGKFLGSLTELWLDQTQIFKETTSHAVRQSCEIRHNSIWFGIPSGRSDSFIGPNQITNNMIAVRQDGDEFKLLTPDSFEILGIVIGKDVFAQHVYEIENIDLDPTLFAENVLCLSPERRERLSEFVLRVLEESQHNTILLCHAAARNALREAIVGALVAALGQRDNSSQHVSLNVNRYRIVTQIRDYIIANRNQVITVPDLCRNFYISRRMLQYCFQEVVGMTPVAYLRALRLNGARRDLRDVASHYATVQDIAATWGFWHLSQFARDYQRLFGELPSASLRTRMH